MVEKMIIEFRTVNFTTTYFEISESIGFSPELEYQLFISFSTNSADCWTIFIITFAILFADVFQFAVHQTVTNRTTAAFLIKTI